MQGTGYWDTSNCTFVSMDHIVGSRKDQSSRYLNNLNDLDTARVL